MRHCLAFCLLFSFAAIHTACAGDGDARHLAQGCMSGEPTDHSIILHARVTSVSGFLRGDVPGGEAWARFEVSAWPDFRAPFLSQWLHATAEHDFIIKLLVDGLQPGRRYWYRLHYGLNRHRLRIGPTCTFCTLPGRDQAASTRIVVVTGMNYAFFHFGADGKGKRMYTGADKSLGYPALATIASMRPDLFIGTGDNVYYDHPAKTAADTPAAMRRKWHEQFVQPRFVQLFAATPTYWEKDDHDHRFNDNDNTPGRRPSSGLGIRIFREQVPITPPGDANALTYRTHRVSRDLQIWLTEGRDYRSPNRMPDGPDKTLWGAQQLRWLKQTLLDSDASFKVLVSPTPLVGPDSAGKRDNHCNPRGFRHEGDAFFRWLSDHPSLRGRFFIICGDRHWQYHSLHPTGFEEFSCGALVDANSRLGVAPGAPRGSDPDGLVRQLFTSREPSGGFLRLDVHPGGDGHPATAEFCFFDEHGELLYSVFRFARPQSWTERLRAYAPRWGAPFPNPLGARTGMK